MDTATIITIGSLFISAVSVVVAIIVASRNKGKDDRSEGKDSGMVMSELGYIKGQNDRILLKQDKQDEINSELRIGVSEAKALGRRANERIDEMKGTKYHEK